MTIADKLRADGRVEGRVSAVAEMLLRMLDHRAWPIPASIRARVLATSDEGLLQGWFDRALAASSIEEVFQPREA